jgi:[acyl-carrier-protein] S-malonyltransferase
LGSQRRLAGTAIARRSDFAMKVAFLFPGQGSQKVGMGQALFESEPLAREAFEEADEALGTRISSLCFEGPEEELRLTANTQPAMMACSVAALRVLQAGGLRPDFVAGHSLGEYTALVAAGSLRFDDALRLVRQRGRFMQEAVPPGEGAMAAVVGMDGEAVAAACSEASSLGVCAPANLNSPRQTVIAGHRSAVEYAMKLLKEKGARRIVLLAVSAPFHTELMTPAADRLAPLLEATPFSDLAAPLVANIDASLIYSGDEARNALARQVASPVRWCDSVVKLIGEGVTKFIEIGPGKVLSGLVREIAREREPENGFETLNVEDPKSLGNVLAAVSSVPGAIATGCEVL